MVTSHEPYGRSFEWTLDCLMQNLSRQRHCYWPFAQEKRRWMMTSSNGNIFRVTGPLCGEFAGPGDFPTQRPVTRSFDVFFDMRLNKRLSKQTWGWWFETPSWSLRRQCNGLVDFPMTSWMIRQMESLAILITGILIVANLMCFFFIGNVLLHVTSYRYCIMLVARF